MFICQKKSWPAYSDDVADDDCDLNSHIINSLI